MCVAVPGLVVSIAQSDGMSIPAQVVYGSGEPHDVDLAMVPDAVVGSHVIVHSGFAIAMVSKAAAQASYRLLSLPPGI